MDLQETYKVQRTTNILLSDQHYFSYVFKKTEKIVCVVLYIIQNHKDTKSQNQDVVLDIGHTAKKTLDAVLATLPFQTHEARDVLIDMVTSLVRLESAIWVGQSVGLFSTDTTEVLHGEIEGVMRSASRYLEEDADLFQRTVQTTARTQRSTTSSQRPSTPAKTPEHTQKEGVGAAHSNRQEQILNVIGIKKTVSIKDLSDDIKDCSEKTIQRELNTMIDNGLIKREGERRWSRYSLI